MGLRKNAVATCHGLAPAKTLTLSPACAEMLAKLEERKSYKVKLTDEQERFLLLAWPNKRPGAVAEAFQALWGMTISIDVLRVRFKAAKKKYGVE